MDKDTSLHIALLPVDICRDKTINLDRTRRMGADVASPIDIIVLPELFSTGFTTRPEILQHNAEAADGPTIGLVKALAAERDCAVCGSFLCVDDGRYFNRAFFVKPDGCTAFYDKRHLFSLGHEGAVFTAGEAEYPIVEFRSWKIAFTVCYDLRFPVWCRNRGYEYEMMIVVANWPESRRYAWEHLLIARAIENQAVYVGCDRGGEDASGSYDGMCRVYGAEGHPLGITDAATGIVYAEFDKDIVDDYRAKLPTRNDADRFRILLPDGECLKKQKI